MPGLRVMLDNTTRSAVMRGMSGEEKQEADGGEPVFGNVTVLSLL